MREILFRGKRMCNGKMMFGLLMIFNGDDCYIVGDDFHHSHYRVHPETVGQFTGLTDKNGKKIFEGDIVRCIGLGLFGQEMVGHIVYGDCCFSVKKRKSPSRPAMDLCNNFEVIGNIHDNPELLEG